MGATDIRLRSDMLVKPVQHVGSDLSIVRAARVSVVGSEADETPTASGGLVRYLMRQKHGTPFEHASLTFLIEAPIFVFREFHRHRIGWSYSETSGRYRTLDGVFWVPDLLRNVLHAPGSKPARPKFSPGDPGDHELIQERFATSYRSAWTQYSELIDAGIAGEVARSVLPVGTYSSMYATCNPRSLMAFLSLRTHDETAKHVSYPQAEIEDVARQMEVEFSLLFPLTHAAFCEFGRTAP